MPETTAEMSTIKTGPDKNFEPTADEKPKRRVEVVTIPIKDIGPIRKIGLKLATWIFGSPLTWAMHWAIRVEDTYFELYRPGGISKPRLRSSKWSEEKQRDIITTVPIGSTTLSDEEIVAASEPYFTEKTRVMWYNIYINNCQLFVHFSLERITPTQGTEISIPPALHNTITLILGITIYTLSLPPILLYIRYLRWRGCDEQTLKAYAALYISATGMAVPMAIISLIQNSNLIKSIFETEPLFIAAYSTFITSIMISGLFLIQPRLSFPIAKQRRNGTWGVSTIQKQNNEREEEIDPEIKIKVTYPWISVIIGGFVGAALWVVIATPYIIRRSIAFLGARLEFGSPLAFVRSVWELITLPAFERDGPDGDGDGDGDGAGSGAVAVVDTVKDNDLEDNLNHDTG